MDSVTETVLSYVKREYLEEGDTRDVAPDTPLISGGIVDSFSMVALKRFLEKTYALRIPDELATPDAFDSVGRIATLVSTLKARQTP